MPELPEVQTVVDSLAPRIIGRTIENAKLNRQDVVHPSKIALARKVKTKIVVAIFRRAKRIVFTLDDGNRFYIHLGMSGRLTLEKPSAPIPKHTHAIFYFDKFEMRFRDPRRFGGIWWLGKISADDPNLGPEPLTLKTSQLARRLSRTKRAIKNALLDQRLIAGLGNIYVDEALFAAKIHPLARADRLQKSQVQKLNLAIKKVLKRAINHRGSTLRDYADADGIEGGFQKLHRVYGRTHKPCDHCHAPIQRIVVGGRSTHFCAACQKPRKS